MHVELKSGIEAARLLKRNPGKYLNRVKGLYILSAVNCEVGQVARSSYFFLREIDDLLDGDRHTVPNPLRYVSDVRSRIAAGKFNDERSIFSLAEYSIRTLEKKAKPRDNPTNDFLEAIDCMIFDHHRSRKREALSAEQLDSYYRHAFLPLHNLMFIGLGSDIRAGDVSKLAHAQGAVYSARDLKDDWNKGIINLPSEVLSAASLSSMSKFEEVQSSPLIKEYLMDQLTKSKRDLEELNLRLDSCLEWLTVKMCRGLIKPMIKFINKYLQKTSTPKLQ